MNPVNKLKCQNCKPVSVVLVVLGPSQIGLLVGELCEMLWDMVRLRNFDVEHPYNRAAAKWLRGQHADRFPIDRRSLRNLASSAKPALCNPQVSVGETWPDAVAAAGNSRLPNGHLERGNVDAEIRFLDLEDS